MTPDAELGQHDLEPAFERQILDENNHAVDVTGLTVQFNVLLPGILWPERPLKSVANVIDARGGYVSHTWEARETKTPGVLSVWVIVSGGNTTPRAFPTWGYWTVRVLPQLL